MPWLLPRFRFVLVLLTAPMWGGCDSPEPIVTYAVPTKVPEELVQGKERMLAAMVPAGDQVWFFKVTGPEDAIASIETSFRQFVTEIQITDGTPDLSELPEGWRRGGEKPMRFASIDVDTPGKQLDISVSQLGRQSDWDEQVNMNVNRWRGQLGLSPSQDKWAGGEPIEVAAADAESIWVDLVGEPSSGSSMTPPFAGAAPFAGDAPFAGGATMPAATPPTPPPGIAAADDAAAEPDPRVQYDRPEGWRDGRASSMRLASFEVGPPEAVAELTVIPAGGDLRGNVARWLGQVRGGDAPEDVVDAALENATTVEVDGRSGQRFFLTGEDPQQGTAIDATIVPMDGGVSMFIKMTGPVATVSQQSEAIESFLQSLKLNL